jgi:hypothetical protein
MTRDKASLELLSSKHSPSQNAGDNKQNTALWGLLQRKPRWSLSRGAWALLLSTGLVMAFILVFVVHPFLSVTSRVNGEFLVVEGWVPDYAIQQAVSEFNGHSYKTVIATGEPLSKGSMLSEYHTFAEVGAATLKKLGVNTNQVVSVPSRYTQRGRTIASASALRSWFEAEKIRPHAINIVTLGGHARRTRILYQKVLGKSVDIGVIAVEPADYDPKRWWHYSAGVRAVISDLVGYLNARLFGR